MSNPTPDDEFTQIFQRLRTGLLGFPGFAELVKDNNFYDFTDPVKFVNFKPALSPGDVPEVALLEGRFLLKPFGSNSRVSEVTQAWTMVVTHESIKRITPNRLKIQTLLGLRSLGSDLRLPFVRDTWISEGTEDWAGQGELARGTLRWSSSMNVNVNFYLAR